MSSSQETLELMRRCALRAGTPDLGFAALAGFVQETAGQQVPEGEAVRTLAAHLEELSRAQQCQLTRKDGTISRVFVPFYYTDRVRLAYQKLEENPEAPFPTEDALKLNIPMECLQVMAIKSDFVQALDRPPGEKPVVVRLLFPDGLNSIVVTSDLLSRKLLECAMQKLRLYLDSQRNSSYIFHKMLSIFRHRGLALKEMFNTLAGKPGQAVQSLVEASDFSFRFWAHLASFIIQEHREKDPKLAEETGYCQAAYLIGFYTVYHKGLVQKEKNAQTALRSLDVTLRKPPFVFTITDILGLKDNKGVLLTQKYSRDVLLRYIKEKTSPAENQAIAEIVRVRTGDEKEYYIHREVILPLTLKKAYDTGRSLAETTLDQWIGELRQFRRTPEMSEDDAFLRYLEERLRVEDPLLQALLNFELLFLTREEARVRPEVAAEIGRFFDQRRRALLPLTEILGLHRKDLLAQARLRLPIWQALPLLRPILALLHRLFKGSRASRPASSRKVAVGQSAAAMSIGERAGDPPRETSRETASSEAGGSREREALAVYRRVLVRLTERFVGEGRTIEGRLAYLAEKWNPLYDEQAKRHLVEDVNAMIRDYFRTLKRGFRVRPPDAVRIQNLAQSLSENQAFRKIPRKEYLRQYIEVYLIKLLGER